MRETWNTLAEEGRVQLLCRKLPTPDQTRYATIYYVRRFVETGGGRLIQHPEEPTFGENEFAEAQAAFAEAVQRDKTED